MRKGSNVTKTIATVFHPDGREETREFDWPREPGYDLIKSALSDVIKGPLEHVSVMHNERRADMFVDELGWVSNPPLPRNEKATAIYRAYSLSRTPQDPEALPAIAGVAVIFNRIVWM